MTLTGGKYCSVIDAKMAEGTKPSAPPRKKPATGPKNTVRNIIGGSATKPNQSGALSLTEFVEQFSDRLPLSIQVQTGYLGDSSRVTLSAFDRLNVHFVKHTTVVNASVSSVHFSIPTNSALEFSLLYNPNNNVDEALEGFTFKTVADLIKSKNLPRFVCCTKAWKNEKCTINNRELLIIRGKCAPQRTTGTQEAIVVHSITSSTQKILPLDCEGQFTTKPNCLHLYLPEYIAHVSNLFPCEVCIYTQKADIKRHTQAMPQHFIASVITLMKTSTETTLLASPVLPDPEFIDTTMEIPIDIPEVKISVIESKDIQQTLNKSACSVLQRYNPKHVQFMKDANTEENYSIQSQLYSCIREGYETDGIQPVEDYDYISQGSYLHPGMQSSVQRVMKASKLGKPLPPVPPQSSLLTPSSTSGDEEDIQHLVQHENKMINETHVLHPLLALNPQTLNVVPGTASYVNMECNTSMPNQTVSDVKAWTIRFQELQNVIEAMQKKVERIDGIQLQVKNLSLMLKKVQVAIGISDTEPEDESTIAERNQHYVSKMSSSEVSTSLHEKGSMDVENLYEKD